MKLVELLARELSEWPDSAYAYAQDRNRKAYPWTGNPKFDGEAWLIADGADIDQGESKILYLKLASDYKTAVVTRAQWQAERDRQKGGEWKRHRAGRNQPVNAGVHVEVKLRCGDIQQGNAHEFIWLHSECDVAANIMQYRIVGQPQSEEVEMIKVDPVVAANVEAFNGQWQFGQVDGPLVWRDTVNELDAYIEEYTRERDALIERLASEGFALIPPVVTAKTDVLPFEEWQVGDVVEVTNVAEFCNEEIKVGDQLPIIRVDKSDDAVSVGIGTWSDTGSYKFIRRP